MLKKEKEKKKKKKRKDNVTYKLNSIHGCAYQHLIFIFIFFIFFYFFNKSLSKGRWVRSPSA
jgi:hypothetical protein